MTRKEKIQKRNLNRMDYFERKFTPVIYRALRSQIRSFVLDMKSNGIDTAKRNLDRVILNERIYTAVQSIYKKVGVFFANEKYREIQEQIKVKQFGFNAEWLQEIVNYFKLYLLNKATFPITETTREYIRRVLIQGEQEGWGTDVIARKLLETGISPAEQLTMARARMITRTESAKAAFKGREVAKEKSPYKLTSEWIAANDHRTRHSHRLVDGTVIQSGERFSVPVYKRIGKIDVQVGVDLMTGPGDPQASKENVINCRCTTAERVVFEDGLPVMKKDMKHPETTGVDLSPIEKKVDEAVNKIKDYTGYVSFMNRSNVDMSPVVQKADQIIELVEKNKPEDLTEVKVLINQVLTKEVDLSKLDEIAKAIQEKEYNPHIEVEVKADNQEVVSVVQNFYSDLKALIQSLKDEIKKPKKWSFIVQRDKNNLIQSMQAVNE